MSSPAGTKPAPATPAGAGGSATPSPQPAPPAGTSSPQQQKPANQPAKQPAKQQQKKQKQGSQGFSAGLKDGAKQGKKMKARTLPKSRIPVGTGSIPAPGTPGGVLLALILYPVVLAGIQHGPTGVRNWFTAKFFNKAPGDTSGTADAAWMKPSATIQQALAAVAPSTGSSSVVTTSYGVTAPTSASSTEKAWSGIEFYRPGMEPTLIAFGKALQAQGWSVIEHPQFGGVHPVHAPGVSLHYKPGNGHGNAIDVSRADLSGAMGVVQAANAAGLGAKWNCAGHHDHIHVDTSFFNRVNGEALTHIPGVNQ